MWAGGARRRGSRHCHAALAALVGPEPPADRQSLLEAADALLEGHARGLELAPHRRGVGRDAHAEPEATLGEAIHRGHQMREHERMAEGGQEDGGAEPGAVRAGGHRGEEGEGLEARAREQRIAHPDRVVPRRLHLLRHGEERRGLEAARHHRVARGQQHADLDTLGAHGDGS